MSIKIQPFIDSYVSKINTFIGDGNIRAANNYLNALAGAASVAEFYGEYDDYREIRNTMVDLAIKISEIDP